MKKLKIPKSLISLAEYKQWIVHSKKIPFNPLIPSLNAKSNDPETWGNLQDALKALESGNFDGLGFEFGNFPSGTLRVSGIDLDHVIRDDGTLEPFAEEIIKLMNSYTEYSPSGTGVHILCKTTLKDIGRKRNINTLCGIEMYNHGRYFTVTGEILGKPKNIEERTKEFLEVYERYFETISDSDTKKPKKISLTDNELLERIFSSRHGSEIERLFNGDWSDYPSQSEGDLALIAHLMFWTENNEDLVDSLFRKSGLMRPKWERKDYRERTISKARGHYLYLPSKSVIKAPVRHFERTGNSPIPFSETKANTVRNYVLRGLEEDKMEFKKYRNCKTGFENLDRITKLYPGLYVLGAISSLGKTTFACQLADQLAKAGEHVLFFSLEQSRFELVTKGLSRLTAIRDMKKALTAMEIREGETTPELKKAEEEYCEFGENEIIYECGFDTTIETILENVNSYMTANDVKPVVIVDYLQIVRPADSRQNTKDAVDNNVRAFKKLQTENDLVVLLISSLNRANYLTPVDFESFKESGGIEYTADVIWGLQLSVMNDEIFDKEKGLKFKREKVMEAKRANPREVELVCLKNRYGISSYKCSFDYYTQFDYFVPKIRQSNAERHQSEIRF